MVGTRCSTSLPGSAKKGKKTYDTGGKAAAGAGVALEVGAIAGEIYLGAAAGESALAIAGAVAATAIGVATVAGAVIVIGVVAAGVIGCQQDKA
jgi:hypothetical protein